MAGSVNKVILVGNLGKDPEIKHFDEGRAVASFPMATTRSYNDKNGERIDQTDWHNISIWRPGLIKVVEQYVKKGDKIYVEGMLRSRSWEDQEKNTRYITEVIVENLVMLGSPKGSASSASSQNSDNKQSESTSKSASNDNDDLPF